MQPTSEPSAAANRLSRRTLLGAFAGIAGLGALGFEVAAASTARTVAGYNLPFTNLPEAGTIVPVYDSSDGWHTRPSGGNPTGGHHGIDFNGPGTTEGRRVFPIRAGIVTALQYDPSEPYATDLGNMVTVQHADGKISIYCHLSSISVAQNAAVGPSTVLGRIGDTGRESYGAHLHLGVFPYAGAHDIDPWTLLSGAPYANQVTSTAGRRLVSMIGYNYNVAGAGYNTKVLTDPVSMTYRYPNPTEISAFEQSGGVWVQVNAPMWESVLTPMRQISTPDPA